MGEGEEASGNVLWVEHGRRKKGFFKVNKWVDGWKLVSMRVVSKEEPEVRLGRGFGAWTIGELANGPSYGGGGRVGGVDSILSAGGMRNMWGG